MKTNKIYNCDWLANQLEDGSVDLIIADPPYFEVMGEFDFIWPSFEDYLKDVERWAIECRRVLKSNGTLLWYGDDKRIAYAQIIFDKHFNLLNNLVWHKGENFMGLNKCGDLRSFAPCTERILMYDTGEDRNGSYMIFADPSLFMSIKKYFDDEHDKTGMTLTQMLNKFGSSCSHYFGYSKRSKTQFLIPTKDKYESLQTTGFFNKPWDELRKEYEKQRRPFDNFLQLSEVLKFNNESSANTKYNHPTKKPEKLTRALILTCTNPGATILVPFAGSGTECAIAKREGRDFIGFEIDEKYHEVAMQRIEDEEKKLQQIKLF